MKNKPISRLKRGFYSLLTAGALIGCGDNIVDPDPKLENYAPQSTLNVNSVPPSSIRVQYSCTDQNGLNDITDSYVAVSSDTIRTKSMDSTFTMQPGTHIVSSYCTDRAGAKTTAGPLYAVIQPPQPTQSFSQTATLENKIDIRYNATFENLDSVRLDISKNGNPILSKTIMPTAN